MKKMNRKLIYILYIVLGGVLVSCVKQTPINNYKDSIIHYKGSSMGNGGQFKIEKEGAFLIVYVTKYDYNRYEVGDTIK